MISPAQTSSVVYSNYSLSAHNQGNELENPADQLNTWIAFYMVEENTEKLMNKNRGCTPEQSDIPHYNVSPISSTSLGNVPLVNRIAGGSVFELHDALLDLRKARDEAHEEGFPEPSDRALQNADRLLMEMYRLFPRRFEVYPTPDGEIAIDAPDGKGQSVILLCDSRGGALCLVNTKDNRRHARYDTTKTLPDGFVREALADLKPQGKQSPWQSPTTLH